VLAAWLQQPGEGPVLEFDQLVKITFSDSGTKADVLANLEAARAWVEQQNDENLSAARAYLAGEGAFPRRAAINQLGGGLPTSPSWLLAGPNGRRESSRTGPTTPARRSST